MATSAPTSGWSSPVTIAAGLPGYTYTVTPAAGGTVLLQWSADNVNWTSFSDQPMSATTSGGVPSAAVYIRGMSFKAAGTFDTFLRPSEATAASLTAANLSALPYVTAPATLSSANILAYNGAAVSLAAAATLTVADTAWAGLAAGLTIQVGQSGTATLAFSGTAVKENASGTSASNVTLLAAGVYALLQSPTGSPNFRLMGGASL